MESDLKKFFGPNANQERVIGVYLYPYCLLGEPDWNDPYSATEIIAQVEVMSKEVLITRNAGLFVRPPAQFSDPFSDPELDEPGEDIAEKLEFEDAATDAFNYIISEFALKGVVSEPAAPVHIARGSLINRHALITSAGGGREIYLERTVGPSIELLHGRWRTLKLYSLALVDQVLLLECTKQLVDVSVYLPALIAGAYSMFSRGQLSEAMLDAWIVNEQIIDVLWGEHLDNFSGKRKRRLKDTRTYTAAVRLEILRTAGVISSDIYKVWNIARKHRNDLAHRAEVSLEMAREVLNSMRIALEFFTGIPVKAPLVNRGVNW